MVTKLVIKLTTSTTFRILALLLLVLLTSYWDLIQNINNLTFGNDLSMNWAYFDFIQKSVSNYHQYPLWLPGLFSGFPLDTSNLAGLFYPPHWLMIFLPLKLGLNLLTIGHIYLIGVSAFFLAFIGFKLTPWSSFTSALIIMLSPKLMNHNYLGHINLIESIPWLILALLFFIKSLEEKKLYFSILTGLCLALTMTVFSIFYIYALLALGFYFSIDFLFGFEIRLLKERLFSLRYLAVASVSSLALGAVFLLPFLTFSSQSLRTRLTFWEGAFPSLFTDNFNQLFFPLAHRFHDSETLIYVGIPTLLLCLVALSFKFKDKRVVFLLALSLFTVTVALGPNAIFYKIYYQVLPFFHFMRAPLRIWVLFIITTGILAGLGLDILLKRYARKKGLVLILAWGTIFVSLFAYNRDYFKLVDYSQSEEKVSSQLTDKSARIYCLNNCLVAPDGLVKNLQFSSGGEVVLLNNYYDFMKVAGNYSFNGYSLSIPPYQIFDSKGIYFEKQNPNPKLLGLSNTKYVVSPYPLTTEGLKFIGKVASYFIYENQKNLPRLFSVPGASAFTNYEALKEVDFKKEVILAGIKEKVTNNGNFQEQKIDFYSPNKVSTKVTMAEDGFLVLSDTYYPGWEALVDGEKETIYEANGAFRAIKLSSGDHTVVFNYFPLTLKLGILISSFSLVWFGLYSLVLLKKRFD